MRRVRPSTPLAGCLLLIAPFIAGQSALGFLGHGAQPRLPEARVPVPDRFVQLRDLECPLFADAADSQLGEFSLLEAALVASGVEDEAALRRYCVQFEHWLEELRGSKRLAGPPRQRAQDVFEFLHHRILRGGYQVDCTEVSAAMDRGKFNCLSASVLFNCLAAGAGLQVRGLEMPSHAMSRVVLPDETIDVETTCPDWFRLPADPVRQADEFAKEWGQAPRLIAQRRASCTVPGSPSPSSHKLEQVQEVLGHKPHHEPSQLREVSDVQLLAMIYYNRGVDLLGGKQFGQAAEANAKALRLDPTSTTARGNLLATINNWAIELGASARYAEAAEILLAGREFEPDYPTFAVNYVHVHHQWAEHLCRAGQFEEALAILAAAAAEMPDEPYLRMAPGQVYRRWAESAAGQKNIGEPTR